MKYSYFKRTAAMLSCAALMLTGTGLPVAQETVYASPASVGASEDIIATVTGLDWVADSSATISWTAAAGANYYEVTVKVYKSDGTSYIGQTVTGTSSTSLDVQQEIHSIIPEGGYDTVKVTATVAAQQKTDGVVVASGTGVTSELLDYALPKLQIPTPTNVRITDDYVLEFTCDMENPQDMVDQYAVYSMDLVNGNSFGGWISGIQWQGKKGRIDFSSELEHLYTIGEAGQNTNELNGSFRIKLRSKSDRYRESQFSSDSNVIKYVGKATRIPDLTNIRLTDDLILEFECDLEDPESIVEQFYYCYAVLDGERKLFGEGTGITWEGTKGKIDLNDAINQIFSTQISDDTYGAEYKLAFSVKLNSVSEDYCTSNYSALSNQVKYVCKTPHIPTPYNLKLSKDYVLEFECDIPDPQNNVSQEYRYFINMSEGSGVSSMTTGITWSGKKGKINLKPLIDDAVNSDAYVPYNTPFDVRAIIQLLPNNNNYRMSDYPEDSNVVKYTKYKRVESVSLAPDAPIVCKGNSYFLGKTITPADAYYEKIEWSSDNNDIVSVDKDGKITGVSCGTANITATIDDITTTVPVTVYDLNSNIADETAKDEITGTAGDIIDDIANNDELDLSNTDISDEEVDEIKEEITDGVSHGYDFWVNFNWQGRGLGHYKEYWGEPEFWEWYKKLYGDNNGWHFGWGGNVEYEIGFTDTEGDEHHIGNITEFDKEYEFEFVIPDDAEIEKLPDGMKRIYNVVRVHDGVFEIVDVDVDNDGKIIVKSDKYSDFILMYQDIDLTSHTHSYTSEVTKAATCKETGIMTYSCICGESYTESIPKLTTHTFGEWATTKAATCKAEGTQTRKCSICGKEETKSIDKASHKYTSKVVKPTYTAQGYTLHTCSVCGESYKDTTTAKLARTSMAKAKITGISNKTYTGKAITQTPVVKLGSKTLKSGTDYSVSYKKNKAVGTATVTITGKSAYTGTVKATFKINPKKTTLKSVTSPKTKQLKATYSKVSGVTGYQISYSTTSKFTKATTKTASSAKTSKTISKLKKGKTYYVRVRTYKTVNKVKYYSGWSNVKKIKVK